MKFKVGDRVALVSIEHNPGFKYGDLAIIRDVDINDEDLPYLLMFDEISRNRWVQGHEIQLEQVYNSPLMKALK